MKSLHPSDQTGGFVLVEVVVGAAILALCGSLLLGMFVHVSDRSRQEMTRISFLLELNTITTEMGLSGAASSSTKRSSFKEAASSHVAVTPVSGDNALPNGLELYELSFSADGVTENLPILLRSVTLRGHDG